MADEYIKREDAIAEVSWYLDEFCECDYALRPLRGAMKRLPSKDVQPVVHGEWICDSDRIPRCSECDEIALQRIILKFPTKEYYSQFVLSNFCPRCGARMDEGVQNVRE